MPRVLLIGFDPDVPDAYDAGVPCGNPEKMRHGIRCALREMQERGWDAVHCAIRPDETASACIEYILSQGSFDCVVIGSAIRLSRNHGWVFEAVINAVHRLAPKAAIAFNARPDDCAEVAERWLAA
jgi:hypothetical protein